MMLKENSERKIAAPGGTRTHNLLLSWQMQDGRGPVSWVEVGFIRDL